jgi:predicted Zn-dependent peptidase
MKIEIKDINWIKTIFAELPESNSTTIQVLVKAWSVYETKEINWISHFLEHMFFKGWIKYKTPKDVAATIDEIWGEFNAFTGEEYAWYYVKSAPDYIERALDVLADMLVNAQFPQEELEREKWVVIQEIKMYEDLPQKLVIDKFKLFYYWDNSYWRPVLWPEENILKFTRDDLFNYKESLYTKDNSIIIISWAIPNKKQIEDSIANLFKNLPTKKTREKPNFPWIKPEKHEDFYKKWTQQNHIVIWIPWFNLFDERKYAAALLATILWGNMSSILFQEVREKRWLCYYIWASHYANPEDWLFLIRSGLQKDKFEEWKKLINEILDKISSWNIPEEEFIKAKWFLIGKTKMWIETSDQLADFVGEQYLLKWKIETLDQIVEKIKNTSFEEVKNIAKNLSSENRYVYWIE